MLSLQSASIEGAVESPIKVLRATSNILLRPSIRHGCMSRARGTACALK